MTLLASRLENCNPTTVVLLTICFFGSIITQSPEQQSSHTAMPMQRSEGVQERRRKTKMGGPRVAQAPMSVWVILVGFAT